MTLAAFQRHSYVNRFQPPFADQSCNSLLSAFLIGSFTSAGFACMNSCSAMTRPHNREVSRGCLRKMVHVFFHNLCLDLGENITFLYRDNKLGYITPFFHRVQKSLGICNWPDILPSILQAA